MSRTSCRPLPLFAVLLAGACAGHAAETDDATPKPGADPAEVAAELLATDSAFAAAGRNLPVVEALAPMLADDVEMPAPGGFIMGRDSVLKALKANPLNTTAHFHWKPVRVGVSADGRQGFTFGYGAVVSGDSTSTPLKYLAYWVKGSGGWHAVAYKRGRASGPADPSPMDAALPPKLVAAETDPARIEAFRQSLDTAERAFSRDAQQIGLQAAFARYGRTDAVNMGGPGPRGVRRGGRLDRRGGLAGRARQRQLGELGARSGDRGLQRRPRRHHRHHRGEPARLGRHHRPSSRSSRCGGGTGSRSRGGMWRSRRRAHGRTGDGEGRARAHETILSCALSLCCRRLSAYASSGVSADRRRLLLHLGYLDRMVLRRHQQVEHRHHEQREHRPDDHPGHQHRADAVPGRGARAGHEHQREVAEHRRRRGHEHRAEPGQRRLARSPPAWRAPAPAACWRTARSGCRSSRSGPTSVISPTCE